jgi:hypothetical protein
VAGVVAVGGGAIAAVAGGEGMSSVVAGGAAGAAALAAQEIVGSVRRRGQQQAGDAARNRQARERFTATGPPPRAATRPRGPAGLLRADVGVVPFTGRAELLAELGDWCVMPGGARVRLVVGGAGVGKSRLALELMDRVGRNPVWRRQQVGAGQEAEAVAAARAGGEGPVLLVVDYAETRHQLPALLAAAARDRSGRLRVLLLLARSAGEWWDRAGAGEPAVRDLVTAAAPVELAVALDPGRANAEVVAAAVPHFAERIGVAAPAVRVVPDEAPTPVLVLHAAALLAVLDARDRPAGQGQPAPVRARVGVLDELLAHEGRYWHGAAAAAGLTGPGGLDVATERRAVAVACLLGAHTRAEADAAAALARVPGLGDSQALRGKAARWLRQLYPAPGPGWLGWPQPDLLAERHVTEQLRACPELAAACLTGLTPDQARGALTVLSRASAHHPSAAGLLDHALRADLPTLAPAAVEVAIETPGPLPDLLAAALGEASAPLETLLEIARAFPYPP